MAKASFKQDDVGETITSVLGIDPWTPVDLTDAAEVKLVMRNTRNKRTKSFTGFVDGNPAAGRVSYVWEAGDLDKVGHFIAEWQVTFVGGVEGSWPSVGYIYITVNDKLEL